MPWLRDPATLLLFLAGFAAWLLPRPAAAPALHALLLGAVAEELAFRWGVQETLRHRWTTRTAGPVSLANLAASAVFALLHLVHQPPAWALATFAPSLAFGLLWDRHRSLAACALLHLWYNLLLFHLRP